MSQVKLHSSDNEEFLVGPTSAAPPCVLTLIDREVAEKSVLIKNMIEDIGDADDSAIPLPNVNANVLKKVIEWCEHHRKDIVASSDDDQQSNSALRKSTSTDMDEWDQKFMQVDQEMLFEIILAANYMDIKPLLDCGCKTVANMIKGKTPDEIRKTFNIVNDFSPEEEAQIRKENEWAVRLPQRNSILC